jgi:threonyl-tRNA synthetase
MAVISENIQNNLQIRESIRHSAAHVMADVVKRVFPDVQLGIGPPTENGFYYDFQVSRPFTPDDLKTIESQMKKIIKKGLLFERIEISRDEALRLFEDQPFKLEIINEIPEDESITIYRHGDFSDLCHGPHVETTRKITAFKLLSVAGAYWRGDEKNPMLQRIYGTAFESKEILVDHLHKLEEASRRDHRKLGKELELFTFDPIAPASPFFLPKGAIVYNLLINYVKNLYQRYSYEEVITPQIFSTDLWKRSGHYEHYSENMFFTVVDDREYAIKPMNCPAHAVLYGIGLHSYRDLPLRYADFGRLHRYERSGVTHGLTRVRTFSQDDAHIFCTLGQISEEIKSFISMVMESYKVFNFDSIRINLSLRPDDRVGSEELWDIAEAKLEEVLTGLDIPFEKLKGEGAFYGPKIDFFVNDAIGRGWQLGTVQLDFSMPDRFDLRYVEEDGSYKRPVMIHRAMLGSIERFMGVLIEHYGGAFPVWLSPVQVVVIPIADRHVEYANKVVAKFKSLNLRCNVDSRNERMQSKIRDAELKKIPYMFIVGDHEIQMDSVAIRMRDSTGNGKSKDIGSKTIDQAIQIITSDIEK